MEKQEVTMGVSILGADTDVKTAECCICGTRMFVYRTEEEGDYCATCYYEQIEKYRSK